MKLKGTPFKMLMTSCDSIRIGPQILLSRMLDQTVQQDLDKRHVPPSKNRLVIPLG